LSLQDNPYDIAEAGSPGLKFWVPNFIVGTTEALVVGIDSAIFDEVNPDDRRGVLLLQGFPDEVSCLACHPSRPLVAFTCHGQGSLHLWDYDMKLLMNLREFTSKTVNKSKGGLSQDIRPNSFLPQSIAFEPHGEVLAVGFTTGDLRVMDVESLEDIANFAPSSQSILSVKFSPSGVYLAGYDADNHVILFKRLDDGGYVYVGRILAHASPIAGFDFGYKEGIEMMISVGRDRFCVEYNLENSSTDTGLQCQRQSAEGGGERVMCKIEATARPTALMWHPRIGDDVEDRFIVATDEFKFKEFNADSKQCRKTTLAPTFGNPPNRMVPIATAGNGRVTHFAYSSDSKVVGIGSFPLAGDPSKVMGINAHPGIITSIAVSYDGKYLFSSGGTDLSSFMYEISVSEQAPAGAPDQVGVSSACLSLLDGGEGGEAHEDIIDYFYYCQLRAQGEESMNARSATGEIPLDEIPSLMRAVGFYPSEEEVSNMLNEVRYKNFMTTGSLQETINLTDFIALYINHRPVVPLNNEVIDRAFTTILEREHASEVSWAGLKGLLQNEGEPMTDEDLDSYLSALIGTDAKKIAGHHMIDSSSFAEQVLGFEA
jgi:WD40 repeat protein/Ca2+-binding EF-hand superfamily protein